MLEDKFFKKATLVLSKRRNLTVDPGESFSPWQFDQNKRKWLSGKNSEESLSPQLSSIWTRKLSLSWCKKELLILFTQ